MDEMRVVAKGLARRDREAKSALVRLDCGHTDGACDRIVTLTDVDHRTPTYADSDLVRETAAKIAEENSDLMDRLAAPKTRVTIRAEEDGNG